MTAFLHVAAVFPLHQVTLWCHFLLYEYKTSDRSSTSARVESLHSSNNRQRSGVLGAPSPAQAQLSSRWSFGRKLRHDPLLCRRVQGSRTSRSSLLISCVCFPVVAVRQRGFWDWRQLRTSRRQEQLFPGWAGARLAPTAER